MRWLPREMIGTKASPRSIETRYQGYRFRSRLEARWAVFFDAMGIPWQYEAEGYHTSRGPYLPDFLLWGCLYAEVKPDLDEGDDAWMGEQFARVRALAGEQRSCAVLLIGTPAVAWYAVVYPWIIDRDGHGVMELNRDWLDFGMSARKDRPWYFYGGSERPGLDDLSAIPNDDFHRAVAAARGARFEHGEQGR